jgi:putative ABC transport system permease protein
MEWGGVQIHSGTLVAGAERVESTKIFFAETSFLTVLKLDFIAGNSRSALEDQNSIVISESIANKLFGSTDVLGQVVQTSGGPSRSLKITGVVRDNEKTHLPIEALISTTIPNQVDSDRWLGGHVYTYVLLNEHNDIEGLRSKVPAYCEKYLNDFFKERGGVANVLFQPLTSIYLNDEYTWEPYPHGSRTSTNVLGLLIFFLLVIACANYVNLATSRSVEYAGEVGIRKILGSSRRLLIFQFISEPVLIAAVAGLLAILMSLVLLPIFNDLSGMHLTNVTFLTLPNVSKVLMLSIVVGLVAGIYPAFYLVSFEPINILRGKFATTAKGEKFRRALVIFQYGMSSLLIIGVVIVAAQTRYIEYKDIGFEKENVITLKVHGVDSLGNGLRGFMDRIKSLSYVTDCTSSYSSLSAEPNAADPVFLKEDGTEVFTAMNRIDVGLDFFETMGIQIVEGRGFEQQFGENEYQSILINQAAVDEYGWQGYATKLNQKWHGEENEAANCHVIGVVSNFSIGPSHQSIRPLIIFLNQWEVNQVYLRIKGNHTNEHLVELESLWDDFFPHHNFDFTFLNDDLNTLYQKEEQFLGLLSAIWVVIMLITSLGIIGLISFNAELKRKEIAIRKINGASISAIILLLSRKFVLLLLVGNLFAMPIAYYLMNQWLANYDQRIDIGLWPFLFSLLLGLIFTVLTLLYHAVQAANVNPVESLRYE